MEAVVIGGVGSGGVGKPISVERRPGRDVCVEIANTLMAVSGVELGRRIVRGVEALATFFGADYAVLAELELDLRIQGITASLGTPPLLAEGVVTLPWATPRLVAGVPVVVRHAHDLPPEAWVERDLLVEAGVDGAVIVPLGSPALRGTLSLYYRSGQVPPDIAVEEASVAGFMLIQAMSRRRSDAEVVAAEARARAFVEHLEDVVALVRCRDGVIVDVNPAIERTFGIARSDLLNQPITTPLLAPCDPDTLEPLPPENRASALVISGQASSITQTFAHRRQDGRWAWARQVVEPIDINGEPHVVITVTDMTAQREVGRLRERSALHDPITGIPTRRLLELRLAGLAETVRTRGGGIVVVHLDLDGFRVIVDRIGHERADEVLATLVKEVSRDLPAGGVVARLSDDEVGVAAAVPDQPAARELLRKVVDIVSRPTRDRDAMVPTWAFSGAAVGTPDQAADGSLFRLARAACRSSRQRQDRSGSFWDSATQYDGAAGDGHESSLARALERRELELHFQPIVRLSDRVIIGAEALLRWRHPEHGLLAPASFLELAETSGLIVPIGEWCLEEACARFAAAHPSLTIAVNISVRQLGHGLTGYLRGLLNRTAIQPELLHLELTESILAASTEHLVSDLNTIRALGVRVGLDDFGTGYSPLTYLQDLHIDFLKIDYSFVKECADRTSRGSAIVEAVLALAKQLDLVTVAEGVEDEACAASLLARGADLVQGYLFGRPMSLDDFSSLVDTEQHSYSWMVSRRRTEGPPGAKPRDAGAPDPAAPGTDAGTTDTGTTDSGRGAPAVPAHPAGPARHASPGGATAEPRVVGPKLAPPHARSIELRRDHLLERLRQCQEPIVLVAAPAGDGKSTLLAQWARESGRPVAWLSLDPEDSDVHRFWLHLATAIQRADPSSESLALTTLRTSPDVISAIVPLVIDQLARSPMQVVLDDYHLVRSTEIDESVAMLGDRLPEGSQLVIATRHDPRLPLSRWRGRGTLAELRETDLRLSTDEAQQFLTGSMGLSLSAEDVATLTERTEGWIGCLYLAARAAARSADAHQFVESFRGSQRSVLGYLMDEVLSGLDDDLLRLLRSLSVLERFTPSLADSVTHGGGSAARLRALEQTNLLLIPLDDTGDWYRLHHLLRDALLFELRNTEPHREAVLHADAAEWFSSAGYFEESILHAEASGDRELGREMLRRHWLALMLSAHSAFVLDRVDRLDASDLEDPELAFAATYRAVESRQKDRARQLLAVVETRGAEVPFKIGLPNGIAASALLRACYPFEGISVASAAARRLPELFRGGNPLWDALVGLGIAMERWNAGDDTCVALLERASLAIDIPLLSTRVMGWLTNILLDVGDDDAASVAAQRSRTVLDSLGMHKDRRACLILLAEARVAERAGDDREAARLLQDALDAERIDFRFDVRLYILGRALPMAERLLGAEALVRAAEEAAGLLAQSPDAGRGGAIARQALDGLDPMVIGTLAVEPLSERERRVLRLLTATGLSQPEMAAELGVTLNTMKTHVKAVYRKLGVASRTEARARAENLGLD